MKKVILILLSLVLICTMCIGFVACNEDDDPTPEEPETISLFNFAKETEFSFGTFEEGIEIGLGNRTKYGKRYIDTTDEATIAASDPSFTNEKALLLVNDTCFEDVMESLQEIYDANVNSYLEEEFSDDGYGQELIGQNLIDYVERGTVSFVDGYFIGRSFDIIDRLNKEYRIVETEDKGDYELTYIVNCYKRSNNYGDDNYYNACMIEFEIWAKVKATGYECKLRALCELFVYATEVQNFVLFSYLTDALAVAIDNAPDAELYEMSKPYFDLMVEVIDTWLDDERSHAFFNKYAQY